jgi:hypothetical protein
MALGPKRITCPAGCQGAEPMQTVIPVNQLADAGAEGAWLRLIAVRCTYCGCVYTGNGPARTVRGWYDGMHPGWSAVHA